MDPDDALRAADDDNQSELEGHETTRLELDALRAMLGQGSKSPSEDRAKANDEPPSSDERHV